MYVCPSKEESRVRPIWVQPILILIHSASQYFCWYRYMGHQYQLFHFSNIFFYIWHFTNIFWYFCWYFTDIWPISMYFNQYFDDKDITDIHISQYQHWYQYDRYQYRVCWYQYISNGNGQIYWPINIYNGLTLEERGHWKPIYINYKTISFLSKTTECLRRDNFANILSPNLPDLCAEKNMLVSLGAWVEGLCSPLL